MKIDGKLMKCSKCGCKQHKLYKTGKGVAVECDECKTTTYLSPTIPRIEVEWLEEGDGLVTGL